MNVQGRGLPPEAYKRDFHKWLACDPKGATYARMLFAIVDRMSCQETRQLIGVHFTRDAVRSHRSSKERTERFGGSLDRGKSAVALRGQAMIEVTQRHVSLLLGRITVDLGFAAERKREQAAQNHPAVKDAQINSLGS